MLRAESVIPGGRMAAAQGQSLDLAFDKGLQMAFPAVMVQLLQALLEPDPSFSVISRFLKRDPMLVAKVLHVVNTVHYSLIDKVTDINRAAVVIGTNELFKLVLSLSLQKRLNPTFERESRHIFGDWRLTLWSAFAAEAMALRFCPHQAGQAYLGGMLKDLQLFLAFCREDVPDFLRRSELATCPSPGQFAEELAFWGSTHQDLAHAIFLYWGLPVEMAEAVRLHHDFDNAAAHSPLARSIIYATRWSELLHSPEADPGELVPFELALAKQLGLDMQGMDEFRNGLANKFSQLLGQLGIDRDNPDTRLYDKSLSSIQSFYFLALRAVSALSPSLQQPMADTLRDQLRLFWGIDSWDLALQSGGGGGMLFRCLDGDISKKDSPDEIVPVERKGWITLPIQGARRTYGFLSVPETSQPAQQAPLPMFVHMFGMCLDEQRKQAALSGGSCDMKDIPFILARLDGEGAIADATATFLEAFAMDEVPVGLAARTLLEDQLGISPLRLDDSMDQKDAAYGDIVFAPEGRFPATPVYMARNAAHGQDGGSYLLLGDVVRMSPIQSLVHMHQDFMDVLFDSIEAQICLVDNKGVIVYSSPSVASLVGKNIFAVSRPESIPREAWHPALLAGLDSPLTVEASVIVNGVLEAQALVFSPLSGRFRRGYLLTMRAAAVSGPVPSKNRKHALAARHRDPLTGLYGYSQFHMLLQQAVELAEKRKSEVGVIFCDIPGLHRINEQQGYAQGDATLRRTAEAVSMACRSGRDYPCRYGSDEFAVIVTGASPALMESVAAGIQAQMQKGPDKGVFLRIGLAILPEGGKARDGLEMARAACRTAAAKGEILLWAEQA